LNDNDEKIFDNNYKYNNLNKKEKLNNFSLIKISELYFASLYKFSFSNL